MKTRLDVQKKLSNLSATKNEKKAIKYNEALLCNRDISKADMHLARENVSNHIVYGNAN